MFPTFKNLSDRESKRRALLRSIQQDLTWDNAKREAFSTAIWASDVAINLSTPPTYSIATQTTSTSTSTSTPTQSTTETTGFFSKPIVDEPMLQDIGDEDDSLSDIDDSETRESVAHEKMIELYRNNPELANKIVHPIGVKGNILKRWVLAEDAKEVRTGV